MSCLIKYIFIGLIKGTVHYSIYNQYYKYVDRASSTKKKNTKSKNFDYLIIINIPVTIQTLKFVYDALVTKQSQSRREMLTRTNNLDLILGTT